MPWKFFNASGQEKRATVSAPSSVPIEAWHTVGAAGEPAFENGWVNYGGAEQVAQYRKRPDGTVEVRGLVKSGTSGSVVFTLPVGYRPPNNINYASTSGLAFAEFTVAAAGWVQHGAGGTTSLSIYATFTQDTVTTFPTGPQGLQGGLYGPPRVSVLPASPVDGQECYFADSNMSNAGVLWHLRFRSSIADSSGWEFVGGPALDGVEDTVRDTAVTHSNYQTTVGPTITVPVAGVYDIEWEALCSTAAIAGNGIFMSPNGGGMTANDLHASYLQTPAALATAGTPYGRRRGALTTASALVLYQRSSAASVGLVSSQRRRMVLRPVRLG